MYEFFRWPPLSLLFEGVYWLGGSVLTFYCWCWWWCQKAPLHSILISIMFSSRVWFNGGGNKLTPVDFDWEPLITIWPKLATDEWWMWSRVPREEFHSNSNQTDWLRTTIKVLAAPKTSIKERTQTVYSHSRDDQSDRNCCGRSCLKEAEQTAITI